MIFAILNPVLFVGSLFLVLLLSFYTILNYGNYLRGTSCSGLGFWIVYHMLAALDKSCQGD